MRRFAFIAPLAPTVFAAAMFGAGAVQAAPADSLTTAIPSSGQASSASASATATAPQVTVTIGDKLQPEVVKLGTRDVDQQVANLTQTVQRTLARRGALDGAQINLVLTDLKPNRPTFQQAADRPGLSIFDSISIGGAAVEGEVVTADGQRLPVKFSLYSNNLADVFGFGTWQDADRAFARLADNLATGRLVTR